MKMKDDVVVKVQQLPHGEGLEMPFYATTHAAGADLRAAVEGDVIINQGGRALIPTGFAMALPDGFEAQVRPRSGLALKQGVTVLNSPGTNDADYRGEVGVILINHGAEPFVVRRGDRIAQMIVAPFVQAAFRMTDELERTDRGEGGFGSSGVA